MGLAEDLDKLLGANSEKQEVKQFLDTGVPELNEAISGRVDGGIPVGRMIEIFGPASSGKTFLSTMIMKSAQEAGGIAGFSDHERSFQANFAEELGLDVTDGAKWRYIRPKTFEESVGIAMKFCEMVRENKMIDPEAPLVWVFDSVASMIPHDKLYDKDGKRRDPGSYTMRDSLLLAKSCSQSYPALAQFAEDYNMTVLLLNQIRMKPGVMFGDPTTTPGGNAAEFYATNRISISRSMNKNKAKEVTGFKVKSKVVKNKISMPFKAAEFEVVYGKEGQCSIDLIATNLDYLVRLGAIEKASSGRIEFNGKTYARATLIAQLAASPTSVALLQKMVTDFKTAEPDAVAEETPEE